jgi:hypothetical protein
MEHSQLAEVFREQVVERHSRFVAILVHLCANIYNALIKRRIIKPSPSVFFKKWSRTRSRSF